MSITIPKTVTCVYTSYPKYPEGQYEVVFHKMELLNSKFGKRLVLWFSITDGDFEGDLVPMFVAPLRVDPVRGGTFMFSGGSKYIRLITEIAGWKGKRNDRCQPSILEGIKFLAKVSDVSSRSDGTGYSEEQVYSRVSEWKVLDKANG